MKIVFISPLWNTVKATKSPLGLSYLSSSLKKSGYTDVYGYYSTELEWKNQIIDATVLGIHITFKSVSEAHEIAKEAKKINPRIIILPGGPQVTLCPEKFINPDLYDAAIIGEGEDTILELITTIDHNNCLFSEMDISHIDGIVYSKSGKPVFNKPRERRKNLDLIPFPDRTLFKNSVNSFLWYKSTDFLAGRSCIYSCTNCQPALRLIMGEYRIRSVKNVIEEIQFLINEYNICSLHFNDNSLTHNKIWTQNLCEEILKKKINIEWSCSVCEHEVNEDIIRIMAKAGCKRISFGIESGSPRVLKEILNKRTNLDHTKNVIKWCTKNGVATHAYFMMAIPGETKEDANATIEFATNIEVNSLQFTISSPNPCTGYEKIANEKGWNRSDNYDNIVNNDRTPPIITDEYGPEFIRELDAQLIKKFKSKGWSFYQDESILYFTNLKKDFIEHPLKTSINWGLRYFM